MRSQAPEPAADLPTAPDIVPGDTMLLEYAGDGDSNLDHAGVIYSADSATGSVKVYQHWSQYRNIALSAIIKRRKGVTVYVAHITPHWY